MKNDRIHISWKSVLSLRWKRCFPKLVIHEKYERIVKIILWAIIAIGILSCLLTISNKIYALILSISITSICLLFDKAIFQYTSIYVTPFPLEKIDLEDWYGMAFAFPEDNTERQLNLVGCAFTSRDNGHNLFSLFRDWNYGDKDDKENNICLSFVIENNYDYSVYLYPNPERKTAKQFFKQAETLQKPEKAQKEHQPLIAMLILCKSFKYDVNSTFSQFLRKQTFEKPFLLQSFILDDEGMLQIDIDESPILKHHFKVKHRKDLSEEEIEYIHGKFVMRKKKKITS